MYPIYVQKQLAIASSNGVGSISTAATSVITLNTSTFDTARRIQFTSTASSSSVTYTIVGVIEGGGTKTETLVGSSVGAAVYSLWDYTSITSIRISSNLNIATLIGTSSIGGTPWKVAEGMEPTQSLTGALQFSSSGNGMTASYDFTMDDPTQAAYPDPYHTVPQVFNSTSPVGVAASTNAFGLIAVDGNAILPFYAWRLTITSSSSSAGTVYGTVMQSGA